MRLGALIALTLLLGGLLATPPATRAQQQGSAAHVRAFLSALNNGDLAGAMGQTAPNFTLTLGDGSMVSGADAQAWLATLDTPITIVSLQQPGTMQISAVLQFASGDQWEFDFTGSNGQIATLTISGPLAQ